MEVRQVVRMAKRYVADLFEDEQITDVGLEEVVFDALSNSWKVTIGFSRPWDIKSPLATRLTNRDTARSYKVLRIDDGSGHVESLTDHFLEAPE